MAASLKMKVVVILSLLRWLSRFVMMMFVLLFLDDSREIYCTTGSLMSWNCHSPVKRHGNAVFSSGAKPVNINEVNG